MPHAAQDLHRPGANDDYLAARFRDHLMPLRWVCISYGRWEGCIK